MTLKENIRDTKVSSDIINIQKHTHTHTAYTISYSKQKVSKVQ